MEPIVKHTTGTLTIDGTDLVATMAGTRGLFRKEQWSKDERWPLATITALGLQQEVSGHVSLVVTRADGHLPTAYQRCDPQEAVEALVESVVEANPDVRVNEIDMRAQMKAAQEQHAAYLNEVIGVDRRVTLTRLALGGVVGGLLFKKREAVRRRDVK